MREIDGGSRGKGGGRMESRDKGSWSHSGNVSQAQSMPTLMASFGMSSTASTSESRKSRESASVRHGAKPTPQLPMMQVVTPACVDGERYGSQVTCPSCAAAVAHGQPGEPARARAENQPAERVAFT